MPFRTYFEESREYRTGRGDLVSIPTSFRRRLAALALTSSKQAIASQSLGSARSLARARSLQ